MIIFETLMDSRSLFLTANTESIYAMAWLDLKDGPVVVESPPNTLGLVDDFWFHYVTDLGNAGPDKGKGGKFLFLPPDYKGEVPEGYHVFKSQTFGNWFGTRGFLVNGDPKPGVDSIKQHLRIYPLAQAANPPATNFVNVSGKAFNTIHAMDFSFFEEVNEVVQEEPADGDRSGDARPARLDRHREGQALRARRADEGDPHRGRRRWATRRRARWPTGRACRRRTSIPNSAWDTPFIGGSYEFLHDGARLLDARSFFFFYATGITPAMSMKMVGVGSQYAAAFVDAKGQPLDGGKTYRLHLPPGIPAKDFWSLVLYDNQTRSMLQTDQQFPSIGSQKKGVVVNADTSVDVYFGPKAPAGQGEQLGADLARQGLERDPAALRPAAAVLRQDLEARRDRGGQVSDRLPRRGQTFRGQRLPALVVSARHRPGAAVIVRSPDGYGVVVRQDFSDLETGFVEEVGHSAHGLLRNFAHVPGTSSNGTRRK